MGLAYVMLAFFSLAALGILGDLFESLLKRGANLKDSGAKNLAVGLRSGSQGVAKAKADHAKALHEANQATLQLIEQEWGPYVIGKPRKTQYKSSELLAEQGYVGIYRRA